MIGQTDLAHERRLAQLAKAEDLRRARQAREYHRQLAEAAPTSGTVLSRVAAWLLSGGHSLRPVPQEVPARELSGWRRVTG